MYLTGKESRARQREAQKARHNRLEIRQALSQGQITRRDLFKWGIFTATGALALKNGLSPFARSAFAAVPTGAPRSLLYGATKFSQPMPRLRLQTPVPMLKKARGNEYDAHFTGQFAGERPARRLSYHNDYTSYVGNADQNPYRNPDYQARPHGGASANRMVRPPTMGPVFPQGRVRDVVDAMRAPAPSSIPISLTRSPIAFGATAPATPTKGRCRRS